MKHTNQRKLRQLIQAVKKHNWKNPYSAKYNLESLVGKIWNLGDLEKTLEENLNLTKLKGFDLFESYYSPTSTKEDILRMLKSFIQKVDRKGLRELIRTIKQAETFNVGNIGMCIGYYANTINRSYIKSDIVVLSELLNIPVYEARHLYNGKTLDGRELIDYEHRDNYEHNQSDKETVLKYLRSLDY